MRDMDVAARPPDEITGAAAALGVLQRTFEHESLFERGMLVQRYDRARRHLEQDGRTALVVPVKDLHLDAVKIRLLPGHRGSRDKGRAKLGRVDGHRLVHGCSPWCHSYS